LFTFARLATSQWRNLRTTNAIERLHEEFKRQIKAQAVLLSVDTSAMMFRRYSPPGQIRMRTVNGWQTFATPLAIGVHASATNRYAGAVVAG
jgi:transposase-like protein